MRNIYSRVQHCEQTPTTPVSPTPATPHQAPAPYGHPRDDCDAVAPESRPPTHFFRHVTREKYQLFDPVTVQSEANDSRTYRLSHDSRTYQLSHDSRMG